VQVLSLILGSWAEKHTEFFHFQQIGWIVGFIYLLCVGVRLARFNVITNPLLLAGKPEAATKDFMGLPSPAAAGFVASLVLVMLHLDFSKETIQQFSILLLPLLLLVALLMVSNIPYPSFKQIDWQMQTKARPFILAIIAIAVVVRLREFSFAIFFLCYIFYGLWRYVRRAWRKKHPSGTAGQPPEPEEEDTF
jgi:CDP-diacylglycerol--serine O-phosphatidyltransferase